MDHYRGKNIHSGKWQYGSKTSSNTILVDRQDYEKPSDVLVLHNSIGQFTGLEIKGIKLYDKMKFEFQDSIFRIAWSEHLLTWVTIREKDDVFFQTLDFIRDLPLKIIDD